MTAPIWPNLGVNHQSPDLTVAVHQYTDGTKHFTSTCSAIVTTSTILHLKFVMISDASKAVYNRNGGLQITDTAQQIARLQPDLARYPVTSKDNYQWNGLSDQNIIPNWPQQQIPQFPKKTLQFPSKSTFSQYQPDLLQKTAIASDQLKINQQQFNANWPIFNSNAPTVINHSNHNNEEMLPEKEEISVKKDDVPVHDRKKDGKQLVVQNKSGLKSTEDSDYNNEDEEEVTTEPPKKKKKHRKVNKIGKPPTDEIVAAVKDDASSQQMKIIHSGLQAEFIDHDGEADRPGGAVVSLALGMLHSILFSIMMFSHCH